MESLSFDTCLNNKISVDCRGEIKNCPSITKSFGNIRKNRLKDVAEMKEFQEIWHIKKDDIDVCKDCRAYISNPNDIYSKPQKCMYNPFGN